MPTISEILERFDLAPLEGEGGMFRRTYASRTILPAKTYGEHYPEGTMKEAGSAIQYLITPESWSSLHTLPTDEVYHFYLGDPVQLLIISPEGEARTVILGQDVMHGMEVQFTVPAFWHQGSRLVPGGEWALMGTTMAPAYTDDDYRGSDPAPLIAAHPEYENEIRILTHTEI